MILKVLSVLILGFIPVFAQSPASFSVKTPEIILAGVDFSIEITAIGPDGSVDTSFSSPVRVSGVARSGNPPGSEVLVDCKNGRANLVGAVVPGSGEVVITAADGAVVGRKTVTALPGILSILPPFLAIILALTLRQVVVALFSGVWLGTMFMYDYNPLTGLLRVVDRFVVPAIATTDHSAIIVFSLMFGGMVGVISRNGGTFGIADKLIRMARDPRRGQVSAWFLGIVIFFDDYANTLIVGNTMRPVTDRLRISREKLAYIVDSTSAPISSLFFISTWIGYEVGLIDAAIKSIDYHVESAYWIFIDTIPYRFYPILTLFLGFLVAMSGRDFGPMLTAERRARLQGKLTRDNALLATDLTESSGVVPPEGIPLRWWNGVIPILTVLVVGISGLYYTGYQGIVGAGGADFSIGNIIGSANSYQALQWAAFLSCVVAVLMSVTQRLLTLGQAMDAWFHGVKSMLFAMIILVLAWSIGEVTVQLHTADYLVQLLKGVLAPHWLPVLTFMVAALVSFSTGTSWGTMGILMPIVIPLASALSLTAGLSTPELHTIILGTVSSVLAGAVFGDHCSPISDTTILSSMASACDHIDHVKTQLPYALLVALTGMLLGDIPTAFGLPPYISIVASLLVLTGVMFMFGKKAEEPVRV